MIRALLFALLLMLPLPALAAVNIVIQVNPNIEHTGTGSTADDCEDDADVCPAPTAILFHAVDDEDENGNVITGTECTAGECVDAFRELQYEWDFGDSGSCQWCNWATDGTTRSKDYGPVVSHVYDSAAGSPYTVTLTVTQPDGTQTQDTATVYIDDPDTVWPAADTVCATNDNATDVDFSWCPFACATAATCVCTASNDSECDAANTGNEFVPLVNNQLGAGKKRILIEPGTTWNLSAGTKINFTTGPLYVGVPYGETAATIEHDVTGNCNSGGNTKLIENGNAGNIRWYRLNVDSTQVDVSGPTAAVGVYSCNGANCLDNFLWMESSTNDVCYFWVSEMDGANVSKPYRAGAVGSGASAYLHFVGNDTLMDQGGWDTGNTGACGSGGGSTEDCGWGIYSMARYMSMQGLRFGDTGGNATTWVRNRISAGTGAEQQKGDDIGETGWYHFAHNRELNTKSGGFTFRCHLGSVLQNVNLSDNYLPNQGLGAAVINLANTYNSTPSGPGCQDVLIERNYIGGWVGEHSMTKRLTIRNNVLGPLGRVEIYCGIGSTGENDTDPSATWAWPDDYYFVANSAYGTNREPIFDDHACGDPEYLPDIICKNNVIYDTGTTSTRACASLRSAWMANANAFDNNAGRNAGEDVTITACPFYGTTGTCDSFDWTTASHWELNADAGGGALIDSPAGEAALFVEDDFLHRTRASSPDIGAMETSEAGGGASCTNMPLANGDSSPCGTTADAGTCTSATFTCDAGHTGSGSGTCSNGSWINVTAVCSPDACAAVDLTIPDGTSTPCDGTASGASCTTFTCDPGFTPSGSADCLAGTWSGDYACNAVTASCGDLTVNRGYGAGCNGTLDTVSSTDCWTCAIGYEPSGTATCDAPVWNGDYDCVSSSGFVCP